MDKILVVEDDPVSAAVMTQVLQERGYEVHTADRCRGAYELARKIRPTMIVLDVMLMDGVGFTVSREVRKDPELFDTGILFVSAVTDKPEIEFALEQGGDAYLTKPITKTEFCEQIDSLRQMIEATRTPCPITGLASMDGIRRRTNHRLFCGENLALCCMKVSGLKAYRKKFGAQASESIIVRAAEGLKGLAAHHGIDESLLGHIGAGYFMMLLTTDYEPICREFISAFDEVASRPEDGGEQRLFVGVAVTDTLSRKYARAKGMIDDLNAMLREAAPLKHSVFLEVARRTNADAS